MTEKPNLPVELNKAQMVLDKAQKMVAEIQTPDQADKAKLYFSTLQKLYHKEGEFKDAFKASELWIEADRKLYEMLNPSGRTDAEIAEALGMKNKGSVKKIRHELKSAYDRPENKILELKEKAFKTGALLTRKLFIQRGKRYVSTGAQDWYTPPWVYERARHIMGSIDLDPASSKKAVAMGNKAGKIFTKEDDGLLQDWGKKLNIFCNPPYKMDDNSSGAKAFLSKLMNSDYKQAIFVTLEDSGTTYGQVLLGIAIACFTPRGRIHFVFKGEGGGGQAPNRSTLVWGINVCPFKFWLAFRGLGHIATPHHKRSQFMFDLEKRQEELKPWLEELKKLPKPPVRTGEILGYESSNLSFKKIEV